MGIQRKQFYQELWHEWVPRKITTMIGLSCNEGLLLAGWKKSIGMLCDGLYNLCDSSQQETLEHAFMSWSAKQQASMDSTSKHGLSSKALDNLHVLHQHMTLGKKF